MIIFGIGTPQTNQEKKLSTKLSRKSGPLMIVDKSINSCALVIWLMKNAVELLVYLTLGV